MASEPIAHAPVGAAHEEEAHASNLTYIRVGIILAIITAIEVFVWYLPEARGALTPMLIVLSVAKFLAVVGYFMHLKYDKRIFRFMFFAGLAVALAVFLAVLAMFWTATTYFPIIGG
jgi:cytochrome c oxidase subunit 4